MNAIDRLSAAIAGAGAFAGASAWALGGAHTGNGALVGALVVYLNWIALRWLLERFVHRGARRGPLVALLLLKMVAIFVVCWVLVVRVGVHGLGFALGLTALPIGLVLGAAFDRPPEGSEPGPRSPTDRTAPGKAEG